MCYIKSIAPTGALPSTVEAEITREKVRNKGSTHRQQLRNETLQLLDDFYQPFNEMLADLLQDQKYLWRD